MGEGLRWAERWHLDGATWVEVEVAVAAAAGRKGGWRYRLALVQGGVPVLVFTGGSDAGHRFCLRDRCLPYAPYGSRRLLHDFWGLVHQLTQGGAPCAG